MKRIIEHELMGDKAQAEAYANADFKSAEKLFLDTYNVHFSNAEIKGNVLDLGCGPGNISFLLANHFPESSIIGIEGSVEMIKLANERQKTNTAFNKQIQFITAVIPCEAIPQIHYTCIVSNSLLHHLHHPEVLWTTIKQYASANTKILIVDLFRPTSQVKALAIVDKYAFNEPEILQRDFYNSLLAAFTIPEIEQQLLDAGLSHFKVKTISDRHVAIVNAKTG